MSRMTEEQYIGLRELRSPGNAAESAILMDDHESINSLIFKYRSVPCTLLLTPKALESGLGIAAEPKVRECSVWKGHAVGRLAIAYPFGQKTFDMEGTAFVVAKIKNNNEHVLILQTAGHNVRNKPEAKRPIQWYWTPYWEYAARDEFPADYFQCTEIASGSNLLTVDTDPRSLLALDERMQEDIAFLRVRVPIGVFEDAKCLAPMIPVPELAVGVVGYPSVDLEVDPCPQMMYWSDALKKKHAYLNSGWAFGTFFGFQFLILTAGRHSFIEAPNGTHSASTLPGFSGSPITPLLHHGSYTAMHIGGPTREWEGKIKDCDLVNHNTTLNNCHKAFLALYKQHVLPHVQRSDLHPEAANNFNKFVSKFLGE